MGKAGFSRFVELASLSLSPPIGMVHWITFRGYTTYLPSASASFAQVQHQGITINAGSLLVMRVLVLHRLDSFIYPIAHHAISFQFIPHSISFLSPNGNDQVTREFFHGSDILRQGISSELYVENSERRKNLELNFQTRRTTESRNSAFVFVLYS